MSYDVVVIGGGPGGYVCAIRAAQLGLKTACVEGRGKLGGTCLNVGCIPSKALLHASEQVAAADGHFAHMGIQAETITVDIQRMMEFKQEVVDSNTAGIEFLFKKNKVDYIEGWGQITGTNEVTIATKNGEEKLTSKHIVIATGSDVTPLKGVDIDEKRIISSTGALDLKDVPERMVVIGAGVIGLELGSVWSRLGTSVTVIEYLNEITPGQDKDVQRTLKRLLQKQGLNFVLGAAVTGVKKGKAGLTVSYTKRKNDAQETIDTDAVLVAIGRRPYTEGLGLEAMKIALDEGGRVAVNERWQTSLPNVYAIGDVTTGPMLAHKAEDEGVAVAEQIAGQHGHVNYDVIPAVIYTHPEVASVGKTEQQLKEEGIPFKVGKFSFMGNGRAKAMQGTDGFAKVLAHKETDRILGVHIVGPAAGEMIHEYCVAMEFGAAAEDIARTCHAHPTLSEALREAAMACGDGPIHS